MDITQFIIDNWFAVILTILAFPAGYVLYLVERKLNQTGGERNEYYMLALREHKARHGCEGGLAIDQETKKITHMRSGYDD